MTDRQKEKQYRRLQDVSLIRDGLPGIPVPDFVDENVSTKVVRIIQSYVGVVNKMVVIGNFACTFFGKGKWTFFRKVKCTS